MALQLIDLSAELDYVEIDPLAVPYTFNIKLKDRTYTFTLKYNETHGFYTVDLFDSNGDVLCFGEVIRYGRPLFNVIEDERFPIPVIIPYCLTDDNISEVTKDNLGNKVLLYIYERVVG